MRSNCVRHVAWLPPCPVMCVKYARRTHAPQVRTTFQGGNVSDETYKGEFYCVKCKAKRTATGHVVVNEKGTRMAKGKCPECGTNLNRILGKA